MSENTPKTITIGPPITEKQPFKKLKILSFLAPFISKTKAVDIVNFVSVRYFSKGLLFLKTWHIRVNYYLNYRLSNLLLHFFCSPLGYFNDRQTKIAGNWTNHLFENIKMCFVKVSSSLTHPPQNKGPLNFLWNWTESTS